MTTDKEACAPNLQCSYFSSSVIKIKQTVFFVRYSGREVNVHRSAEENTYGLGGGDGRGLGVGACLGVGVGLGVVVGVAVGVTVAVAVGVGVTLGVGVAVGVAVGVTVAVAVVVAVGVAVAVGVGVGVTAALVPMRRNTWSGAVCCNTAHVTLRIQTTQPVPNPLPGFCQAAPELDWTVRLCHNQKPA